MQNLEVNKEQLQKLERLYSTFTNEETPIAVALKTLIDGMRAVLKPTKNANMKIPNHSKSTKNSSRGGGTRKRR